VSAATGVSGTFSPFARQDQVPAVLCDRVRLTIEVNILKNMYGQVAWYQSATLELSDIVKE